MLGRTPGNIAAIRPMHEGAISDYDMTERMLKEFVRKALSFSLLKPKIIISVPSCITEVEERAVIDAGVAAGAVAAGGVIGGAEIKKHHDEKKKAPDNSPEPVFVPSQPVNAYDPEAELEKALKKVRDLDAAD